MNKKIIALVLLILMIGCYQVITPADISDIQLGLEMQEIDNRLTLNNLKLDLPFSENNWAIHTVFNFPHQATSLGIVKKYVSDSVLQPYAGFGFRDLFGAYGAEIGLFERAEVVGGISFNLSDLLNGLSIDFESRLMWYYLFNSANCQDNYHPTFGISFNYRFNFLEDLGYTSNEKKQTSYGARQVSEADIKLMAKIITAEAANEPYDGQVAVGAVIMNRLRSGSFPNSISQIIYQPNQFATAAKAKQVIPTQTALKAAREAVNGRDPSRGAFYFYNPAGNPSPAGQKFFSSSNLSVTRRIGHHVFFKKR